MKLCPNGTSEIVVTHEGINVEITEAIDGLFITTCNNVDHEDAQTVDIKLMYNKDLFIDGFNFKELVQFWIKHDHLHEELPF